MRTLYVVNLPRTIVEEAVREAFLPCGGEIEKVVLGAHTVDRNTHDGTCHILFDSGTFAVV